jgi:hypothetical protein
MVSLWKLKGCTRAFRSCMTLGSNSGVKLVKMSGKKGTHLVAFDIEKMTKCFLWPQTTFSPNVPNAIVGCFLSFFWFFFASTTKPKMQ